MRRTPHTANLATAELVTVPSGNVSAAVGNVSASVRAELERLVDVVADLQASSHADSTIERYTRQWGRFVNWCVAHRLSTALPVPVEVVMLYVADWTTKEPPPAHGTIVQALAAIDWVHANHRLSPPRSGELEKMRRGVRNRLGVAPRRKAAPLLLDQLVPLGRHLLAPTRTQLRDAVVIGLRSLGLSYGEITGLSTNSLVALADGHLELRLARRTIFISLGSEMASVGAALTRWLERRNGDSGPLACRLRSNDSVVATPISDQSVRSIILKWASRANLELTHATAVTAQEARVLLEHVLAPTPSSVRNMACIWLLWAGALRSDELVHVRLRHLAFERRGLTLTIPRSKTDQAGHGLVAFVPRGEHLETDVVGAVERWIEMLRSAGATDDHFLFCPIDRHENLCLFEADPSGYTHSVPAVSGQAVTRTLREVLRRAEIDGINPALFSSHSGKRGIATQLAKDKADISEIAKVTRHKSLQTVMAYVDEEERKSTSALLNLDL